jgi:hypothetical protein
MPNTQVRATTSKQNRNPVLQALGLPFTYLSSPVAGSIATPSAYRQSMDRSHELESLRRSLAMLRPGAHALDREEAMRLVRELQGLESQIQRMRDGLMKLLEMTGPSSAEAQDSLTHPSFMVGAGG